jgi:SagB-type dehydrogenase family enzyme
VYVVIGAAEGLDPGVYGYVPHGHALEQGVRGDLRRALWDAALQQDAVRNAPMTIVIAAVVKRTAGKYGSRAGPYVHIEVGATAQNISLQAVSLGLGSVLIGAFQDDAVRKVLGLASDHAVIGIVPVGRPLRK